MALKDRGQLEEDQKYEPANPAVLLNKLYTQAEPVAKKLRERSDRATKYYKGDHWFEAENGDEGVTVNLIFMAIETIVAIMTDRDPEIIIVPAREDEESIIKADSVQDMVKCQWYKLNMQEKMEHVARQLVTFGDSFIYNYWDKDRGSKGNVNSEVVHPKNIRVNPEATNIDDAQYIFISTYKSIHALKRKYGKKAKDVTTAVADDIGDLELSDVKDRKNAVLVQEFWGWVEVGDCQYELRHIIKAGDVILENEKNPYFDHKGSMSKEQKDDIEKKYAGIPEMFSEGKVGEEDITNEVEGEKTYYNFFDKERFPITHFRGYGFGDTFQSLTSKVEQVIELNKLYNKRKTQITLNAEKVGNPYWVVAKDSGIDADQISEDPGPIFEPNNVGQVRMESAPALPSYVMNDLDATHRDFDNGMAVHDISRGEVGQNRTAREAMLLKDADEGGIALIIRSLKRGIEDIGKWWVHLMKMYYEEEHTGAILGREGSERYVSLMRDDIEDGISLYVESGSIEPKDKNAERIEYIDLAKGGFIDPITLLNKLGISNPEEVYEDTELHKAGKLSQHPELQPPPPPEGPPPGPEGELPPEELPPEPLPPEMIPV